MSAKGDAEQRLLNELEHIDAELERKVMRARLFPPVRYATGATTGAR